MDYQAQYPLKEQYQYAFIELTAPIVSKQYNYRKISQIKVLISLSNLYWSTILRLNVHPRSQFMP